MQEGAVLYVRKSTVRQTAIRYVRQLQMVVRRLKLDFMKFSQLVQEKKIILIRGSYRKP